MTSDFPLQIFDHSYAVTNKADDLTDSSSTTSSSSSEFSLEPKTKFPSEKDSYSIATPKSSPGEKTKSPKRLSTSVHRKTKGIGRSLRSNNRTPLSKIKTIVVSKMRTPACGQCEGCKREDCGHCVFCKDKVKFGGPGKKKQKCLLRACKLMPLKKGAAGKLMTMATDLSKMSPPLPKADHISLSNTVNQDKKKATPSSIAVPLKQSPTIPPKTVLATTPSVTGAIANMAKKAVKSIMATNTSTPAALISVSSPKSATKASTLNSLKTPALSNPGKKFLANTLDSAAKTASVVKEAATPSKSASSVESTGSVKKISPRLTTSVTSSRQGTNWGVKMKCEQCGRERYLSVARTERFCTQRCVLKWLEEHPDKTPKDAVGDSDVPLFALPSLASQGHTDENKDTPKSVPRALKNLQIDMAPPGTTLHLSSDEDDDQGKEKAQFTQPATIAAKRSHVNPQPLAIKKAKPSEKVRAVQSSQSSKSVKFDLGSTTVSTVVTPPAVSYGQSTAIPGSISIVPLDRLSEFMRDQQKRVEQDIVPRIDIKLPEGLTKSVKDWSVEDVFAYFKSTKECSDFSLIFKEQEIDGFNLLRLTDQMMCRCLSLPLGKVIKILAHVDELRKL